MKYVHFFVYMVKTEQNAQNGKYIYKNGTLVPTYNAYIVPKRVTLLRPFGGGNPTKFVVASLEVRYFKSVKFQLKYNRTCYVQSA